MTLEEFYALPRIMDFFPLKFESGAKWTRFSAQCGKCQKVLDTDSTRGSVVPMMGGNVSYRDLPNVVAHHIVAQSYCTECKLLTSTDYVCHENMTITGRSPHSGLESEWATVKTTWLQNTWNFFF